MSRPALMMIILSFVSLVVLITMTKVSDYDFWWHLQLGRSIAEGFNIAAADTFSYTFAGMDQFNGEWLADLLLFTSFKAGGYLGVNLLKACVLLLTFSLLAGTMISDSKEGRSRIYAVALTLVLVLFSLRFRLFPRPFLFSYFFLAAFLFVLNRYSKTGKVLFLYSLPLLVVIWANTSKGVFLALPVFLLFMVAAWREGTSRKKLVGTFLLVAVATLAGPEGFRLYPYLFERLFLDGGTTLGENAPLSLSMLWGYGWRYTLPYQILVVGSLGYFVFLRGWRNPFHLLLFILFIAASVAQVRMIDFFSIISAPLCFVAVERLFNKIMGGQTGRLWIPDAAIGVGLVVTAVVAILWNDTYAFGVGPKETHVPEGALSFLDREEVGGTLFNSYPFGGYIIWRSEKRKVFIDGRKDHLYSQEFYDGYFHILHTPEAWAEAEKRWGFDCAVLEYDPQTMGRHFPFHLNNNLGWALVYWDDHSVVYLKRTDANAKTIEKYGYEITRPNLNDFKYLDEWVRRLPSQQLLEQIDREIAYDPTNQEPRLAKVYLLYTLNARMFLGEMEKELERCLEQKPDWAIEHSALAIVLFNQGRKEEAKQQAKRALELDPGDQGANYLKDSLDL